MLNRWRTAIVVLAVPLQLTGCVAFDVGPSAERTTLDPGWPTWFRLEWAVEPGPRGTRRIDGYLHNAHGEVANEVMLLTQALDNSGAVQHQRIERVVGSIPPLSRTW